MGPVYLLLFVTTEEQNLLAVGLLDYSVKPLKHGIPELPGHLVEDFAALQVQF